MGDFKNKHSFILGTFMFVNMIYGNQLASSGNNSGHSADDGNGVFKANQVMTLDLKQTEVPPVIDGVIEDAWLLATPFGNFVENNPTENRKPLARTEGFITYDKDNLYFAFVNYDPDMSKLRANLSDRDKMFLDDFIGINIDPFGNKQTSYEFFVNPRGIQGDLLWQNSSGEDPSYDALWHSEAKIYDDHWSVEMQLPLRSLRFPNGATQDWLIHMLRIYPRESRFLYSWMPVSQNNNSLFSQAGHMKFETAEKSGRRIEFLPYVLGSNARSLDEKKNGNGKWSPNDRSGEIGFNAKYGISSNLTLDFTYNPDFSQIESDASQISTNNTFALFFPEKRPFFLEGSDIFSYDGDFRLLYTRTINNPIVAGKLTGKIGKATIGVVSAFDQTTPYILPFEEQSQSANSNTNSISNIARVKYDFYDQTFIGAALSNRSSGKGRNTLASVDGGYHISDKWSWKAIAAYSATTEPTDSVLNEDIDNLSFKSGNTSYTSLLDGEKFSGVAFRTTINRESRNWNMFAFYQDISPTFRAENGFINANNNRQGGAWNGYAFRFDQNPLVNEVQPSVFFYRKYNYDGTLKDEVVASGLFIAFKKQTYFSMEGPIVNNENYKGHQFNQMNRINVSINTQAFQRVSGGARVETGKYINRNGDVGDTRNPLIIAKGLNYSFWSTMKITSKLRDDINFESADLWQHYGGPLINNQKIIRNTMSYQFTRRWFLRLIAEYSWSKEFYTDTDNNGDFVTANGQPKIVKDKSRSFSVDPLLSYKINPFTVFYVGAHIGGEARPYPNYDGLTQTAQNVFVKFQYFMPI